MTVMPSKSWSRRIYKTVIDKQKQKINNMEIVWTLIFSFLTTFIPPILLMLSLVLAIPATIFKAVFKSEELQAITLAIGQILFEIYGYLLGVGTSVLIVRNYLGDNTNLKVIIVSVVIVLFFARVWAINTNEKKKELRGELTTLQVYQSFLQASYFYVFTIGYIVFLLKPNLLDLHFDWLYSIISNYLPKILSLIHI